MESVTFVSIPEEKLWESIRVVEMAVGDPEFADSVLNLVKEATEYIWGYIEDDLVDHKRLTFACVFGIIITYTFWKGRSYGESWCKHGEKCSIFSNVARKFDRIENIIVHDAPEGSETRSTTIADLLVYSSLWLTWLSEHEPINMMNFVKFAKSELLHTEDSSETGTKEEKTITPKEEALDFDGGSSC